MGKKEKFLDEWVIGQFVAGIDEVGKGCGAGPVVSSAVILPKGFRSSLIRDSKQLNEKQRNEAYKVITENAIAYTCNAGSVKDINAMGINPITFKTMHKCIDDLTQKPDYILVDGDVWENYKGTNGDNNFLTLIPKGDDLYTCIAAASIVAKVRRDEYMTKLHELFPIYNWKENKGYLTPEHIDALKKHGWNKHHRLMFIKNFII